MTDGAPIGDAYLSAARSAAAWLRDPAVAATWGQPSALLVDLAVREHGPVAVLRALSRASRAPRVIAGI